MSDALIARRLTETARLLEATAAQAPALHAAVARLVSLYRSGGKLLLCGNGGSAADAQHIAGELTGRFLLERAAWPAIALHANTSIVTALANDYGPDSVFSRQVEALGALGDVLWVLSTSGNSSNCIAAMQEAKKRGLITIAFVGGDGGKIKRLADICIHVPSSLTPRIQEAHITLAHIICELVEEELAEPSG